MNIKDTDINKTEENKDLDKEPTNWIHVLCSIPTVGGLLTFVIAIAPVFVLILIILPKVEPTQNVEASWIYYLRLYGFILIAIPLTWWWLNYLERKINLAICLPIPFIDIPIKWFLYPLMLPFFGINWIYRHFSSKRHIDNSLSPDMIGKDD